MVISMKRWEGKVAVVTGASSGIGVAIAEQLVENGLIVAGIARRVEKVEEHAKRLAGKKGRLHAIKADVTKDEDIIQAFKTITEKLGTVHILINNAGYATHGTISEIKTENLQHVFGVNVFGLCYATREAIKIMNENKINGHIVHINSIAGHNASILTSYNVYSASKYAVTALTDTLRKELADAKSKIKVTSVSPGLVATEMTTLRPNQDPEAKKLLESLPILNAEDIADGVVYALSTPEHVQVHELTIKPVGEIF